MAVISHAVKHIQKSFWPGFNAAAGIYAVGEVFDGDPAYTCDYQKYIDGILNYPQKDFWICFTVSTRNPSTDNVRPDF
jgi:hypothetical protein